MSANRICVKGNKYDGMELWRDQLQACVGFRTNNGFLINQYPILKGDEGLTNGWAIICIELWILKIPVGNQARVADKRDDLGHDWVICTHLSPVLVRGSLAPFRNAYAQAAGAVYWQGSNTLQFCAWICEQRSLNFSKIQADVTPGTATSKQKVLNGCKKL